MRLIAGSGTWDGSGVGRAGGFIRGYDQITIWIPKPQCVRYSVKFTDSNFAQLGLQDEILDFPAEIQPSNLRAWTLHRSDIPAQITVKSAARIKERGGRLLEYWMLFPILCDGNERMTLFLFICGFCLSFVLYPHERPHNHRAPIISLAKPKAHVIILCRCRRCRRCGRAGMCLDLGKSRETADR